MLLGYILPVTSNLIERDYINLSLKEPDLVGLLSTTLKL